jgi:hypothetical protein
VAPVTAMIQDNDLKDCLLRIDKPKIINYVLELMQQLLINLNEPTDSPKFAFKARANKRSRNDADRPLNFSINDLVVLSLYAQGVDILIGLLIDEKEEPKYAASFKILKTDRGQGNSTAYWIIVSAEEFVQSFKDELYLLWKDKCQKQLSKAIASPYKSTRTEELHHMVEDAQFRIDALKTIFPTFKAPTENMTFFQQDDLDFFQDVIQKNKKYRTEDPESIKIGKRIKETIFDKTSYWAELVVGQVPELTWRPDNHWNVSGNFKGYSWVRLWLKEYPDSKVFFTLSVSATSLQLKYIIDCQRDGVNRLSLKEIKKVDDFLSAQDIDLGYVAYDDLDDYDWDTLTAHTVEYIKNHMSQFRELTEIIYGKGKGMTKAMPANNQKQTNVKQCALNSILYGPPGTGKTYHTIDKALKIVAPDLYDKHKLNRKALTDSFRDLLIKDWSSANGQIAFTTFHQSMSYEDFVEGIKPVKPDNATFIHYEVIDGIFKKLCIEAGRKSRFSVKVDGVEKELTKELFKEFYDSFATSLPDQKASVTSVQLKTKENATFELYRNGAGSIVVKAGAKKTTMSLAYSELSAVLFEKKSPTYASYEEIAIKEILKDKEFKVSADDSSKKKYVLIIDEINRGNVSQIFGELITLIEQDKRQGQTEELQVVLPYSKKTFSVPSNLYIIGTMNTADRSVEALDTALRRRFSFEEMMPDTKLLSTKNMICNFWNKYEYQGIDINEWMKEPYLSEANAFYSLVGFSREKESEVFASADKNIDRVEWLPEELHVLKESDFTGINLQLLLETINGRLEKLISKDHQIGHAFFISVASVENLYDAFYQKLIPQLQEYFYGDFGKIGLVLGNDFVKSGEEKKKISFASFSYEDVQMLQEKPLYRIHDFVTGEQPDYKSFFESVKKIYQ